MSQDGAHDGLDAAQALDVVLGDGDVPDERRDPVQMRDWLLAATEDFPDNMDGYNNAARYAGKLILQEFMSNPRSATYTEDVLYALLGDEVKDLRLTGFQWGWAMNAARYCVELPPVPNPAIIEIQSGN